MSPPDWKHCTEEQLWHYVAWHLDRSGIETVLVGGAVVAIYTEGLYRSGDLDMVAETTSRAELKEVLSGLGFQETKSRYFKHPECPHLFIEFPNGPVEIGDQRLVIPEGVEVHGRILKILSPTDSVKDRLAGYIHWGTRSYFDQAALICRRQSRRIDMASVKSWCDTEGGQAAFDELMTHLRETQNCSGGL